MCSEQMYTAAFLHTSVLSLFLILQGLCCGCSLYSPSELLGKVTLRANKALSTFTGGLARCIRPYRCMFVHKQVVQVG